MADLGWEDLGDLELGDLELGDLELVDLHCHGIYLNDLDRPAFAALLTEGPAVAGVGFDNQVGVAVRRWCAPVLDLPAHASPEQYLARRAELGPVEVARRLLGAARFTTMLVDTGLTDPDLTGMAELGELANAPVREVVRLETVAEQLAGTTPSPARFAADLEPAIAAAARDAVGCKSIVAYRHGLDVDPHRPTAGEVIVASERWLRRCAETGRVRMDEPVLLRHLIWCAVGLGKPLQFHTGYGDRSLALHRCDPLLLTGFLRLVEPLGTPVVLLHGYPFARHAGYLAQVFGNVYADVGLAVNHTGPRAAQVLAEFLELAPFPKVVFSSDGYGLPELHYLGAALFRSGLSRVLGRWVASGDLAAPDAARYAQMIGAGTARRLYGL